MPVAPNSSYHASDPGLETLHSDSERDNHNGGKGHCHCCQPKQLGLLNGPSLRVTVWHVSSSEINCKLVLYHKVYNIVKNEKYIEI